MNRIIITGFAAVAISLGLAPLTSASPAMCSNHHDAGDMPNGYGPDGTYITACGGDSGPDAAGNNATAPKVDTTAH